MFSRRAVAAAALILVALAVLVGAGIALVAGGNDAEAPPRADDAAPIAAVAAISPRIALFGDTVSARIDTTVDNEQLDPALVRVKSSFGDWSRVGDPTVKRQDSGSTTYLRTTFLLRCLIPLCVPTNGTSRIDFKPAKVSYEAPVGEGTERLVIDADWPVLVVHSRLDASDLTERDPLAAPWRADLTSLPEVTYRIRPGLLTGLLLAGGVLFVLAGALLGYRALPRRREPAPPPPPPPKPVLSPLEQALILLEAQRGEDGVEERRRALELVADELAGWKDPKLERTARALAWSEDAPAEADARALAATVRTHVLEGSNGRPD
jgi:hypothetical protein